MSVWMITYQQAPYIAEALESVLMQNTNFPFEICLGEDDSTDGTRKICTAYAEKYPDIINLFLRSREDPLRRQYPTPGRFNNVETLKACRGLYIAMCEGDDYWTDPFKLQKQVDILQENPGLSGCVHYTRELYQDSPGKVSRIVPESSCRNYLTVEDTLDHTKIFTHTCSFVCRNYGFPDSNWTRRLPFADRVMFSWVASHGHIRLLREEMAVWRRHPGGVTSTDLFQNAILPGRLIFFRNIHRLIGKRPSTKRLRKSAIIYFSEGQMRSILNKRASGTTLRLRAACNALRVLWAPSYLKAIYDLKGITICLACLKRYSLQVLRYCLV